MDNTSLREKVNAKVNSIMWKTRLNFVPTTWKQYRNIRNALKIRIYIYICIYNININYIKEYVIIN